MSVTWSTKETEEQDGNLATEIKIRKDSDGDIWIDFDLDRTNLYTRKIHACDKYEMSRFFYEASDFMKG